MRPIDATRLGAHLGLGIHVPDEKAAGRLGAGTFDQARWLVRNVPIKSVGEAMIRMVVQHPYR
ncbi:MAG TPA: hypothetical protein VM841_09765 [Actinomycetota bacterium]|nr:hypothetical protein [Actinomycetota bacterium]